MPEIKESIYIDRPPKEVHQFMIDNVATWQANVMEYELLAEKPEKGARYRVVNKVAGRWVESEGEYTELELGSHDGLRSIKAPMEWTLDRTFEPSGTGTMFTYHMKTGSLGGFFGKLADPVVTRIYTRDVQSNLANLKELLEA